MKSFIDHIIADINPENLAELRSVWYVFPTQRACRYFESKLADRFNQHTFWSPEILSIQEFIQRLNPQWVLASEIQLVTELFTAYQGLDSHVVFDEFYSWGKVLLKDFDEVDRYLVDANLLYKNLQDIKELEKVFGPDKEALQAIIEFQKVMDVSGKGSLFTNFDTTWKTVGQAYHILQKKLTDKQLAYEGMLYRQAAKRVKLGGELPFSRVVFAGFNALSLAEEVIFEQLLQAGKAQVYVDADRFYVPELANDATTNNWEAGRFLTKYHHRWKGLPVTWVDANGFEQAKTIEAIGVPLKVAQAKVAAQLVANTSNYPPRQTAIVLADEWLLNPVLHALPVGEHPINITMGRPMAGLALGELVVHFVAYQTRIKNAAVPEATIAVEALQTLLNNRLATDSQALLYWAQTTKHSHVSWQWLQNFDQITNWETQLLMPEPDGLKLLDRLMKLVENLFSNQKIPDEAAALTHQLLAELKAHLQLVGNAFDVSFIKKLVTEQFALLKLPLGSEVTEGLQVMGFLETRMLDFKHLIVLSVNEGMLPAGATQKTFIPYGLRKAFKMPHFTEQDSIFAYHFYRLLQRAQRATLVYNTETTLDGSGEKSRYLLQLAHRIKTENKPVTYHESGIRFPVPAPPLEVESISISKTTEIQEALLKLIKKKNTGNFISPSFLLDYIECPLRFYWRRIKKLKAPEVVGNDIDAREFGNIVHRTMQELYTPYLNSTLTGNDIAQLKKEKLRDCINNAFATEVGVTSFTGKIEFERDKVMALLSRLLTIDAQQAPFKLKGLELVLDATSFTYSLTVRGQKIVLGGTIDRLDEITLANEPLTRVLDYKTGKTKTQTLDSKKDGALAQYIETYFTNSEYKAEFQSYCYALVYQRNHPEQPVTAGIYNLLKLSEGVKYVQKKPQPISEEFFIQFETRLIQLLQELLDPKQPFTQTLNETTCNYCEFKEVCGRF